MQPHRKFKKEIGVATVLITGADGFIGQALGAVLKLSDFQTIGVSLTGKPLKDYDKVYPGELCKSLEGVFESEKIDAMVHCANAAGSNDYDLNVNGTTLWAEQARDAGVERQILLSSISVLQQSPSSYARAKKDLEKWFVAHDGLVLRLGMVIGDGGIFGRMKTLLKKFPAMPLLDNGAIPIYFLGINSVCNIIKLELLRDEFRKNAILNIQQEAPVSMREFLLHIKKRFNYFCYFIPIPSALILYTLLLIEKIGIRFLPISSVNIKGARQNRELELDSDYSSLGFEEHDIAELISQI